MPQGIFCVLHDPHGSLLPQREQIAAARAEQRLHRGAVALYQRIRYKSLDRSGKAAALHPPCTAGACKDALADGQRHRQP